MSGTRGKYSPEIGRSNFQSRQRETRIVPGVDWVNRILPVSEFNQAMRALENQIHFVEDQAALHSTEANPGEVPYWMTDGQVSYVAPINLVGQIEQFKKS